MSMRRRMEPCERTSSVEFRILPQPGPRTSHGFSDCRYHVRFLLVHLGSWRAQWMNLSAFFGLSLCRPTRSAMLAFSVLLKFVQAIRLASRRWLVGPTHSVGETRAPAKFYTACPPAAASLPACASVLVATYWELAASVVGTVLVRSCTVSG